jgi:transcriptional regulator with XRE-family HTH domain
MNQKTVYDRIRSRTKPETRRYVQKNLAVVAEVSRLLKQKGWTQKEFAKKLGKSESEVSKWLSGLHNLTLKSIAKIETVLEAELLKVPETPVRSAKNIAYVVMTINKPFWDRPIGKLANEESARFEKGETIKKSMVA